MNRLLWIFITTMVLACACEGKENTGDGDDGDGAGDGDAQVCCLAAPVCAPGEETFHTLEACEAASGECIENSVCCSTVYCGSSDGPSGDGGTTDQDAGDSAGGGDTQVCCLAAPVCAPGEETFHTLEACEAAGGECTENSVCCSTVYCRSSDGPSGDGGITGRDAGDSSGDDDFPYPPRVDCAAVPSCAPDEETYWTPEACEAAGGECTSYSMCNSTVYCRSSDCEGTIVDVWGCRRGDYCTPLSSGEYCTGHRDGCSEWSWPITLPNDGACPEDLYCESELPDGRFCVHYEFESDIDCMNTGDYITPPIGTIVPCNPGDTALGLVAGFEPSLCCLDTTPGIPGCEADATPVGDCEMFLGWGWDGEVCGAWFGCSCEGEGCDDLYDSKDECNKAQQTRGCLPPDCRTVGCDEGYICDVTCYSDYACVPDGTRC